MKKEQDMQSGFVISKHVRYMTWGWIVGTIGLLILAFIGGGYFK
jgi:hypothetical protein